VIINRKLQNATYRCVTALQEFAIVRVVKNHKEDMDMNNVGKSIKKLRAEKGLTQDQLAERLHVTRQAVSNWETGKTQPDIETLSAMADCFEIPVEELIYGKETQHHESKVVINKTTEKGIDIGAAVGVALAVVLSYTKWQSIGWAIFHGLLNWAYVIYYVIRY